MAKLDNLGESGLGANRHGPSASADRAGRVRLGAQAWLLRELAAAHGASLLRLLEEILEQAPFRHMVTPGGRAMAVAMSNCGELGWTSDRLGYRYRGQDPLTGQAWPAMPPQFVQLAQAAADAAGFGAFRPDACLINRYLPGTRLSLHQDRDERDFGQPIVSVSLGLPAVFLFGGLARSDRAQRVLLEHGDVAVWGGEDRLRFHGVLPLKDAADDLVPVSPERRHELLQGGRINLTFRKAG